ncbi:MAG: tetratricopeptide repeat protein [Armatimonadetes bacterium]|nr:tetratricopeptide repeat protein [Armatimonadota bacterium]MDW8122413.1 tetratricopeptide repeat protein [Armatimonadota bacterium]
MKGLKATGKKTQKESVRQRPRLWSRWVLRLKALALFYLAHLQLWRGQRKKAVALLEQASQLAEDDPFFPLHLALIHSQMSHPEATERYAHRATAHDAVPAAAWTLAGKARYQIGRMRSAERSFQKALSLSPTNLVAATGLAVILAETGRLSDAIALLQASPVADDPDLQARLVIALESALLGKEKGFILKEPLVPQWVQSPLWRPFAFRYFRREGEKALEIGDWERAQSFFFRATQVRPDDFWCLLSRSVALAEMGAFSAAKELLDRLPADRPEVTAVRGILLIRQGRLHDGLSLIKAVSLDWTILLYYEMIGSALSGEPEEVWHPLSMEIYHNDPSFLRQRIRELITQWESFFAQEC